METHPRYFFKADSYPGITDVDDAWDILRVSADALRRSAVDYTRIYGSVSDDARVIGNVFIENGAEVHPFALIDGRKGPIRIGEGSHILPYAYIRENTFIGAGAKVGSEVKGSVLMDGVRSVHRNSYIGDSVIGNGCNIGAGFSTANLRFDEDNVMAGVRDTGRKKLGCIMGDRTKTGINAGTYPGTLIGPGSLVEPGSMAKGFIPANSYVKRNGTIIGRRDI